MTLEGKQRGSNFHSQKEATRAGMDWGTRGKDLGHSAATARIEFPSSVSL